MVFLPLGVLIPRYARGLSGQRWWLPVHGAVNGVLGGALIIATYALSQQTLGTGGGDDSSSHTVRSPLADGTLPPSEHPR